MEKGTNPGKAGGSMLLLLGYSDAILEKIRTEHAVRKESDRSKKLSAILMRAS